jgi:Na+(H+)/acetate symporter ActP
MGTRFVIGAGFVVLILMAGYAYARIISGYLPLASIGLISFCAVANFAPGLMLGLYWRGGNRYGVVAGLAGGFVVWLYALLLPTLNQVPGIGMHAPLQPYLPAFLAELDPVGQASSSASWSTPVVGDRVAAHARNRHRSRPGRRVRSGAEPEQTIQQTPADAARLDELRDRWRVSSDPSAHGAR